MYGKKIIEVLTKYSIPFWTHGKNVSEDTINIKCPFCNDHSNHCGIFKSNLVYSCWRCQAKGHLSKLLTTITHISYEQAKNECDVMGVVKEDRKEKVTTIEEIQYPEYFQLITGDTDIELLNAWMKRRKIDKVTLIEHKCGICEVGDFSNRLIIPVFYQDKLVAYQGADLTGKATLKYRTSKAEINNYLYNYDNIGKHTMVITEGVLDAWRVGNSAVASFGTHLTDVQKRLILDKNPDTLVFLWDRDAYLKAKKESGYFMPFIKNVHVIALPYGEDPDSYGHDNTHKLIEEKLNLMETF